MRVHVHMLYMTVHVLYWYQISGSETIWLGCYYLPNYGLGQIWQTTWTCLISLDSKWSDFSKTVIALYILFRIKNCTVVASYVYVRLTLRRAWCSYNFLRGCNNSCSFPSTIILSNKHWATYKVWIYRSLPKCRLAIARDSVSGCMHCGKEKYIHVCLCHSARRRWRY